MEKNKSKAKLNDDLLDKVSGGEYNPFDLDGDGYMDMGPVLHCSNCTWSGDNPTLSLTSDRFLFKTLC